MNYTALIPTYDEVSDRDRENAARILRSAEGIASDGQTPGVLRALIELTATFACESHNLQRGGETPFATLDDLCDRLTAKLIDTIEGHFS
jgi:hypothetical protein